MATSAWSADYYICTGTINDVEKCAKGYISLGYEPAGGVSQYGSEWSQAVWLK